MKFLVLVFLITSHVLANTLTYPCQGQSGAFYTNPDQTKGGFVADSAVIDNSIFLSPDSTVCGRATVIEGARLADSASVSGRATVRGNVQLLGRAQVYGDSYVFNQGGEILTVADTAKIFGQALLNGSIYVGGSSQVFGWAKILEFAQVHGNSRVCASYSLRGYESIQDDSSLCPGQ